jgi:hypothetical protein
MRLGNSVKYILAPKEPLKKVWWFWTIEYPKVAENSLLVQWLRKMTSCSVRFCVTALHWDFSSPYTCVASGGERKWFHRISTESLDLPPPLSLSLSLSVYVYVCVCSLRQVYTLIHIRVSQISQLICIFLTVYNTLSRPSTHSLTQQ